MTKPSDMVVFLMPDGSEVSNDPRFGLEEALEEQLAAREYSGDAGIPHDEQKAQTQIEHMAPMQSGQPGVGENAVTDPHDLIPNVGTPAMVIQKEDRLEAEAAGADLTNTSVKDADPVDSNAAVESARQAKIDAAEEYRKAQEKLGEAGLGDPEEPFSKWKPAQLRVEIASRNADRAPEDMIDVSGAKKKSDLVKALEADDAALAGQA